MAGDKVSPQDLQRRNGSAARLSVTERELDLVSAMCKAQREALTYVDELIRERYRLVDGDQIAADGTITRAPREKLAADPALDEE